jgi:hypothetical protein
MAGEQWEIKPTCLDFPWTTTFRIRFHRHLRDKLVLGTADSGEQLAFVISEAELTRAWVRCVQPHLIAPKIVYGLFPVTACVKATQRAAMSEDPTYRALQTPPDVLAREIRAALEVIGTKIPC